MNAKEYKTLFCEVVTPLTYRVRVSPDFFSRRGHPHCLYVQIIPECQSRWLVTQSDLNS